MFALLSLPAGVRAHAGWPVTKVGDLQNKCDIRACVLVQKVYVCNDREGTIWGRK